MRWNTVPSSMVSSQRRKSAASANPARRASSSVKASGDDSSIFRMCSTSSLVFKVPPGLTDGDALAAADRLQLHAAELGFNHPHTGQPLGFLSHPSF
jgi:hypothetical protein